MSIFCPHRDGDWDRQHSQTNDGKTRDRKHKVTYQPMQHTKMLATQREAPLEQQQRNKQATQQRSADIIHQRNLWHGMETNEALLILSSASPLLQRERVQWPACYVEVF